MTTDQKTPWIAVLALWAGGLGAAGQFAKISVPFAELAGMYPQAGAALSLAVSMASVVGVVLGVVAGKLAAQIGYRRLILWALAVSALLSLVQAAGLPFPLFLLSRLVEGGAHLAIVVSAPTLIAQITPDHSRPIALTVWSSFFAVAYSIVAWGGLPLVQAFGVPSLFFAHGVYMAMMLLVVARLVPRAPAQEVPPFNLTDAVSDHRVIYTSPYLGAPALVWLCYCCCFVALITLWPATLPSETRTTVTALMPLTALAVTMTLCVACLRRYSAFAVVRAGLLYGLCAAAVLALFPGSVLLILTLTAGLGVIQGAGFALVPELNETGADRARANGAMAQMGNLGNMIGTPILMMAGTPRAMALTCAVIFLTGFVIHGFLARQRRVTVIP